MKRYCKKTYFEDKDFMCTCVRDCLRNKWQRKDVQNYFERLTGWSSEEVRNYIDDYAKREKLIFKAAKDSRDKIRNRDLQLVPIWYKTKVDGSSGKIREIGIQDISQQFFDYIAVYSMTDFLKRIGEYQVASIPNKGISYGIKHLKKWIEDEENTEYFVQLDIRKCFPSIPQDKLLAFVDKYVADKTLRWLIRTLIGTFKEGLSIGSYLSQYLCNLYLSQLYHELSENMYFERRGKRTNLFTHVLFYMDDILLLGKNSKEMTKGVKKIIKYAKEVLGVEIKPKWCVRKLGNGYIDTMGFRVYRDHTTIRKRVFVRVRRSFKKAWKRKEEMGWCIARKCISYWGYIKNTNAYKLMRKYNMQRAFNKVMEVNRVACGFYARAAICKGG